MANHIVLKLLIYNNIENFLQRMADNLISEIVFKQLMTEHPENTKCFDCGKCCAPIR